MESREIRSTLVTKLEAVEDRSGHHAFFYLTLQGKEYRVGKLSHSFRGQVPDFVISDTAKRLKLTKKEFLELVGCTIDKATHSQLWIQRS